MIIDGKLGLAIFERHEAEDNFHHYHYLLREHGVSWLNNHIETMWKHSHCENWFINETGYFSSSSMKIIVLRDKDLPIVIFMKKPTGWGDYDLLKHLLLNYDPKVKKIKGEDIFMEAGEYLDL